MPLDFGGTSVKMTGVLFAAGACCAKATRAGACMSASTSDRMKGLAFKFRKFTNSARPRLRRRAPVLFLPFPLTLEPLDNRHLGLRALRVFELRVEAREVVVRLRVVRVQPDARFERGAGARVVLQLQVDR